MPELRNFRSLISFLMLSFCLVQFASRVHADPPEAGAFGIAQRVPWTTSNITGSPEPPLPFTTQRVFPQLKFNRCIDMAMPPGGQRFFVVEQAGKIFSFPNTPEVTQADLVIDIAAEVENVRNVYALTFHPDFANNGYCYVCCIKQANLEDGSQIIRFTVADTDPPTIDATTQKTILTWPSGGHNGCCLKFGPDGYLYISTGDGVGPNPPDTNRAGQDISNLFSSILRIDVDHPGTERAYKIPEDNPFVDVENARGEVWAYGFRNPWRMSFDRKTGDLWVGDVGWELWEMLDRVQRGGNYGWSVMEGRQPTNTEWERGPTPILPPTIDHPHSESSSITDGLTYYGSRLPELQGKHIYSDYDTGKFWAFRWQDGNVVEHQEIADTTHRVVGFSQDAQDELYILDHIGGTIHTLVPNPQPNTSQAFPRKLSNSGLFASVSPLQPAPGVIPYSINAELWADHATAQRMVAIPGEGTLTASKSPWSFPPDSVLVKTLSLEMERGNEASRRKIETQVLHFDGAEWQGYSYRWNEDQTDATLIDAQGAEQTLTITDANAAGGKRLQSWRFASRAECQRCHNKWSGPPLGFHTSQLNRDHDYGDNQLASQLETWDHIELVKQLPKPEERKKFADPRNTQADLTARARAYLHVNCAHCHRLHAGGAVLAKMHEDVPLDETNMLGVRPTQGTFGIHAAQVIAPGDPFRSVLLYRLSKLGGGRMPHIGSTEVDLAGISLIHQWIQQMPTPTEPATTGIESAIQRRREQENAIARFRDTPSDTNPELAQHLLNSTSGALMLLRALDSGQLSKSQSAQVVKLANAHQQIQVRDLFERFLPPDQRVRRLGSVVNPEQILRIDGDVQRGQRIFWETAGVACKNCHRIGKQGTEVGPDLSQIGKRLNRVQLLQSILQPSQRIDPQYVTYLVETDDGKLLTGLLLKKAADHIVLKDAQNKQIRISREQIEQLVAQPQSLMPELLVRDMTAQQVADLLAYLSSLGR